MPYDMSNLKKYINKGWIIVSVILCIVFAVLFTPMAIERLGIRWGVLATLAGITVILLSYVIRAIIITGKKNKRP